ncbi:hypothetical protein IAQ61_002476 [Plenodomus lingam]|uniref:Uncharacterized protein n=1 Tax=Leptosphaeria maculans (strain JN3 / isolate v23.1.3 / race Av1-4-5-6-7-8) TaxID=985895 RepID=E4ZII9_LEPMJ|nr:hypothetical protein LEMA_P060440.1 [Plenodomus lingam JN3]KAH9877113.1 hypothetical protein IAQ61_002476 [Plenodomus lingam]CBX91010.1 hypothetical protein LEMA_P060440.1 [Plenodomus lingam JN3]
MSSISNPLIVSSVSGYYMDEHTYEEEAHNSRIAHVIKRLNEDAIRPKLMFSKACQKGHMLKRLMQSNDCEAGQMLTPPKMSAVTNFLSIDGIERAGYTLMPHSNSLIHPAVNLLDMIGFSAPDIIPVRHTHKSFSLFHQIIVPSRGMIIAFDNRSLTSMDKTWTIPECQILDVPHWSDFAYLQWKSQVPEATELKCVMRYLITNKDTEAISQLINYQQGTELRRWPGRTYDVESQAGEALFGSANGIGVAYLLAQHKEQLGHKTVSRITMFRGEWEPLVLLYHVEDV